MIALLIWTHAHWLACIFWKYNIMHSVAISIVAVGASTTLSTGTFAIGFFFIKKKKVVVALEMP